MTRKVTPPSGWSSLPTVTIDRQRYRERRIKLFGGKYATIHEAVHRSPEERELAKQNRRNPGRRRFADHE